MAVHERKLASGEGQFQIVPGESILAHRGNGGFAILRYEGGVAYGFESVEDARGHPTSDVFSGNRGMGKLRTQ